MTKSAMITVCGRPNVGKSTLTNALVGEKVAIVSNKPQTTRNRITAIVSRGDTQFVLMDTPGFHKPRTRLGDYMVNVVKESVADVDLVLLLVEPVAAIGPQEEALIERLRQTGAPVYDENGSRSTMVSRCSLGWENDPERHFRQYHGTGGFPLLPGWTEPVKVCFENQ